MPRELLWYDKKNLQQNIWIHVFLTFKFKLFKLRSIYKENEFAPFNTMYRVIYHTEVKKLKFDKLHMK